VENCLYIVPKYPNVTTAIAIEDCNWVPDHNLKPYCDGYIGSIPPH